MKAKTRYYLPRTVVLGTLILMSLALISACADDSSSSGNNSNNNTVAPDYGPSVNMSFPATLTGDATTAALTNGSSDTLNCDFGGSGSGDPFRNGFVMTQFLVGNVATWMCFTDFLMQVVSQMVFFGVVTTDGTFVALPPDPTDTEAPTGIRVTDSGTVKTVELYWGSGNTTAAGIYYAWSDNGSGVLTGRLILDASIFNPETIDGLPNLNYDPEAPTGMRLDLDYDTTTRQADMFLAFDATGNQWATAFRTSAVKTVADSSFEVWGRIDMKEQWDSIYAAAYPLDVPVLQMYAVADSAGTGAARASMVDLGFGLRDVDGAGFSLGSFAFNKDDVFYFTSAGGGEYINKTVSDAIYRGDQSLNSSGFFPDEATVDSFIDSLGLVGFSATAYSSCIAGVDPTGEPITGPAECVDFLNAVFSDSQFGAEANTGSEPTDARAAQIAAATYLSSTCPIGTSCTWDTASGGVFEHIFP